MLAATDVHLSPFQDQYKLCFEILQSHLDSFDTYANFKAVWVRVIIQRVAMGDCVCYIVWAFSYLVWTLAACHTGFILLCRTPPVMTIATQRLWCAQWTMDIYNMPSCVLCVMKEREIHNWCVQHYMNTLLGTIAVLWKSRCEWVKTIYWNVVPLSFKGIITIHALL